MSDLSKPLKRIELLWNERVSIHLRELEIMEELEKSKTEDRWKWLAFLLKHDCREAKFWTEHRRKFPFVYPEPAADIKDFDTRYQYTHSAVAAFKVKP